MRALVFEQWQGGHYFNYLEVLVPALAAIVDDVVVAVTTDAAASTLFKEQLGHLFRLPNVTLNDRMVVPLARDRLRFRHALGQHVVNAVEEVRPDVLLLPSADEQLLVLPILDTVYGKGVLRHIHVEALLHYPAFTETGSLRKRILSATQRALMSGSTFDRIGFVNFSQYEKAFSLGDEWTRRAYVSGDPVPPPSSLTKSEARKSLGLPVTGSCLGMIGELDARKAIPEALSAFRHAGLPSSVVFLLAGRIDRQHANVVYANYGDLIASGRLVVIDRFLTPAELATAFAAVDVQCSVYRNFAGLSSLMLKGVAAGARTIASDAGWSRAIVHRFGLGSTVRVADVQGFANVMRASVDGPWPQPHRHAVEKLLQFHSTQNFAANVLERTARLAGVSGVEALLWSEVLDSLPASQRRRT